MAIGLNLAEKTAQPLLKKCTTFNSPNLTNYKMVNTKYYSKTPLNPNIETNKFVTPEGINTEFSSKTFQNGYKFEIYRLPDEVIKVLKNKFGEIKAFKSSIEQHNQNPARSYENVKDAMRSKTHNFLA